MIAAVDIGNSNIVIGLRMNREKSVFPEGYEVTGKRQKKSL